MRGTIPVISKVRTVTTTTLASSTLRVITSAPIRPDIFQYLEGNWSRKVHYFRSLDFVGYGWAGMRNLSPSSEFHYLTEERGSFSLSFGPNNLPEDYALHTLDTETTIEHMATAIENRLLDHFSDLKREEVCVIVSEGLVKGAVSNPGLLLELGGF